MRPTANFIPELLAPAGGPEALRAAVANGADAVYLGVDALNARRGAENFTLQTLGDACRFAHLRGVKIYLTANVMILPDEMKRAVELVDGAWGAGVDAVIIQDLGLLRVVRECLPHVRIHASTQMNTHSSEGVRLLAERGVSRITLAREVSVAEIAGLVTAGAECGVEVESFVHGALCVCYSGQCLLSSLVGGRSANRGMCAQPCRLPYELLDEAERVLGAPGAHLLSPKDLAGVTVLPDLVRTGVAALKIEGRMKNPEYVALVTGVYRAALDRAADLGHPYEVRDGEMKVLSEAFSRGFTEAYLTGERGNDMMSYSRPNNRGVLIGRVTEAGPGTARITLDVPLDSDDTIEFWTGRGRFAQAAGLLTYRGGSHPSAPAGEQIEIAVDESVAISDRVFRVRNAALTAAAERTFADPHESAPITVAISARVVAGEPLRVTVRDQSGRSAEAFGSVVEPARTKAVTADEIAEHVGRLGGTPYRAAEWDIELSPNVGIGFSQLHKVRRAALGAYESVVLAPWSDRAVTGPQLPRLARPAAADAFVAVVAASAEVASASIERGADVVHVTAGDAKGLPEDSVALQLSRVCHDPEMTACISKASGRRVVAGTLGEIRAVRGEASRVEAHWSLNAANAYAVAELAEIGAQFVWLSPELSGVQIAEVAQNAVVPVGVGVAGRQEVMVTEHCVLMAEGECDRACGACARRRSPKWLRDRKGYRFPVRTDLTGRTHIYNSVELDLTEQIPALVRAGVSGFRVDAEVHDAAHAAALAAKARRAVRGEPVVRESGATTGHYFRGVG